MHRIKHSYFYLRLTTAPPRERAGAHLSRPGEAQQPACWFRLGLKGGMSGLVVANSTLGETTGAASGSAGAFCGELASSGSGSGPGPGSAGDSGRGSGIGPSIG